MHFDIAIYDSFAVRYWENQYEFTWWFLAKKPIKLQSDIAYLPIFHNMMITLVMKSNDQHDLKIQTCYYDADDNGTLMKIIVTLICTLEFLP